ncbi:asparagine synthase (glutamine-hydrolyzing) [uncultured Methanobacterium sp.]|uniref:asparagine synthase (glutamine-hydrolyzing) n=1 Tax=uncultured Methanobacterium sp. TaxID=176306 RepID=UPI002AA9470F|nr:asparagine synthase (glutamine-hydrolyzing) [uncultured Methanobacterium sp.]
MSGITGIFRRDGKDVDLADIKKMNDKISYRGPDGSRVWCEGPIALGHQMLHTTHESLHEILPFEDEESGLVITADARIDNRKDLAPILGIKDNEYVSDSYFILKAYEKWGEKCPEELLGDFAFAIWDKNKEQLFCARDHMGVKPFYYFLENNLFIFATEMKAIFPALRIKYELNDLKLAEYLLNIKDKKFTFFKNILILEAANSIFFHNKSQISINKYWELDSSLKIRMDSEKDYSNAFRKIFREAVKCRLRTCFPLGFELSGGLDSSSIVCMARDLVDKEDFLFDHLNTFSLIYDGFKEADERYYIQKIVEKGKIKSHYIFSENIDPLDKMENILYYQEQPFFTPFMSTFWESYKRMKNNNIRILLVGTGGDEVLLINNRYLFELAISLKIKTLFKELKCLKKLTNINIFNLLIQNVFIPLIPLKIKNLHNFFKNRSNFNPMTILNQDFVNKLGGYDYFNDIFNERNFFLKKGTSKEYNYQNIDSLTYDKYTTIKNKGTSQFYIEPRYPFFDKRLIEFCYGLPNDMKTNKGWNKYILRLSMENILPFEVQHRLDKGATDQVFYKNFISYQKNLIETIIYKEPELISSYVNINILKQIYEDYKSGIANHNLIYVWFVLLLFLWFKKIKFIIEE